MSQQNPETDWGELIDSLKKLEQSVCEIRAARGLDNVHCEPNTSRTEDLLERLILEVNLLNIGLQRIEIRITGKIFDIQTQLKKQMESQLKQIKSQLEAKQRQRF